MQYHKSMSRGKNSPLKNSRNSRSDLPLQEEDLRPAWRFMNHAEARQQVEDEFTIVLHCEPTRQLTKLLQKLQVEFFKTVGENIKFDGEFPEKLDIVLEGQMHAMTLTKMNPASPLPGERLWPLLLCSDNPTAVRLTKQLMHQILPLFPPFMQASSEKNTSGIVTKYLLLTELETALADKKFKINMKSRETLASLVPCEIIAYAHQKEWLLNPSREQKHQLAASHILLRAETPEPLDENERIALLEFLAYLVNKQNELAISEMRRLY